jgi:hypothetical protein
LHHQYFAGGGLSHRYGIRLISCSKLGIGHRESKYEALPVLEIVVNLQRQVDVVEEVTPPMVHDQRT